MIAPKSTPEQVLALCVDRYEASTLRMPSEVARAAVAAQLTPLVHALSAMVAPDRAGRAVSNLELRPGLSELREVEQAVAFLASNVGSTRRSSKGMASGYDVGAALFSLRDVLSMELPAAATKELQSYIEWLVVLAGESLAHGREQAALERFSDELDAGTPLLMITQELPAAIFVCSPERRVVAGILARLLLAVVRTGAKALIIDISGVSKNWIPQLRESLEEFFENPRVGGKTTVFMCGISNSELSTWEELEKRVPTTLVFENYFDICVQSAIQIGKGR
ncbi:MAG: hypothetical protein JKY56_13585 [Kofleriaceae bacterium]|nr:hypothetical protein [Kofleriaceae bacterium]